MSVLGMCRYRALLVRRQPNHLMVRVIALAFPIVVIATGQDVSSGGDSGYQGRCDGG
jgi:hypothetical protein